MASTASAPPANCFLLKEQMLQPQHCSSSFTLRGPGPLPLRNHRKVSRLMKDYLKPASITTPSIRSALQQPCSLCTKQHSTACRASSESSLSAAPEPAGYTQRESPKRARGDVRTHAVAEAVGQELEDHAKQGELEADTGDEHEVPAFDWKAHWYAVGVVQVSFFFLLSSQLASSIE